MDALILREGDRVEAWGRLVRNESGCWFEPPMAEILLLIRPKPLYPPGPGAVRLVGADFDRVENRYQRDGAVEGFATLTGRWVRDTFQVDDQTPRLHGPPPVPARTTPPCPEPSGGWPHGPRDANLDFDRGELDSTAAAVAITIFHPSPTQAVLVVAAADLDAVESTLRPQLGARLCVVPSRFSRAEIDAARLVLNNHWDEWNLRMTGESTDEHGQPVVTVSLIRVLPEFAAWANTCPHGLIDLDIWLTPSQARQQAD